MKTVRDILGDVRVLPVVVIDDVADAVPLARSLLDGGLPVIEVTLRTAAALEAIAAIAKEVAGCIVGAGSITDPRGADQARRAGAQFGVSPGTTRELREFLQADSWPFLPGAATISEVLELRDAGFSQQKLFPAEILGGVDYLKAIGGPVPDVTFCPTGGIVHETMTNYLRLGNVFAIGGSWIAPRELIRRKSWPEITARAASV
jgi:2-dehydro-3-deoxyphosphogluconate aldolase/(4S)-4-hydroxy-2-oxoglutarate aldolase